MSERSTHHASFTIERNYDAVPAQVFAAWADPAAKTRWFGGGSEWKELKREMDFRAGGREHLSGAWTSGVVSSFDCLYQDIVPAQRIVYSYDMHLDDKRISVSLATVEFKPSGDGTKLVFTEQAVFLDGYDKPSSREQGTRALLERLDAALRQQSAGTL
ncbi:SRPBCC family protein [Undibacterium sp.]|jgi:uncharacterized protein YndB with AHSA1/START domain|uniref:SRPBCC family protein n=1 Tax=Undibacterium sp. TaxID=1914977 RepID=UPI002B8C2548|nr:SRPBCC family protein [Undibacterium sp.]HTD04209.1 SRPBCC family protein [Undibacterium sp.]